MFIFCYFLAVLQAKLTTLALYIGYIGNEIFYFLKLKISIEYFQACRRHF